MSFDGIKMQFGICDKFLLKNILIEYHDVVYNGYISISKTSKQAERNF